MHTQLRTGSWGHLDRVALHCPPRCDRCCPGKHGRLGKAAVGDCAGLSRVPQIPVSSEPVDVTSPGNEVFAGVTRLGHGHAEVGRTLRLCDSQEEVGLLHLQAGECQGAGGGWKDPVLQPQEGVWPCDT